MNLIVVILMLFILSACGSEEGTDNNNNLSQQCSQSTSTNEDLLITSSASLTESPEVSWNQIHSNCNAIYYEVAISADGETDDVVSWAYAGNVNRFKLRYILLERNKDYYMMVRALSNGIVIAQIGKSQKWQVADSEISITSPTPNEVFNSSIDYSNFLVSGNCTDANQFTTIYLDDEVLTSIQIQWCDGESFVVSVDLSEIGEGEHELRAETRDIYGTVYISETVNFFKETKLPALTKIIRGNTPSGNPTITNEVTFKVLFSEEISGFSPIDLNTSIISGGITAQIISLVGEGKNWEVYVDTQGLGEVGLVFNDIGEKIKDLANNELEITTMNSEESWEVIQDSDPEILSIKPDSENDDNITNKSSVKFVVAFNEPVEGLSISDFSISSTGSPGENLIISEGEVISGETGYLVTINNIDGSLGTIGLNFNDIDGSIKDKSGNLLKDTIFTDSEHWNIDKHINKPTAIRLSSNFVYGDLPVDSPLLFWSFADSDIDRIELALGTNPISDIDNFVPWEPAQSDSFHSIKYLTGLGQCVKYYPSIRLKDKAGNISSPLTDLNGFLWDNEAPIMDGNLVIVSESTSTSESPTFTWSSANDTCGVDHYEIAVGSVPGGTDILSYKEIPGGSSLGSYKIIDGLDGFSIQLEEGKEYYSSIIAVDISQKVSNVIVSNSWLIE